MNNIQQSIRAHNLKLNREGTNWNMHLFKYEHMPDLWRMQCTIPCNIPGLCIHRTTMLPGQNPSYLAVSPPPPPYQITNHLTTQKSAINQPFVVTMWSIFEISNKVIYNVTWKFLITVTKRCNLCLWVMIFHYFIYNTELHCFTATLASEFTTTCMHTRRFFQIPVTGSLFIVSGHVIVMPLFVLCLSCCVGSSAFTHSYSMQYSKYTRISQLTEKEWEKVLAWAFFKFLI